MKPLLYSIYFFVFALMSLGATKVHISEDASDAMLEKGGNSYQRYLDYLEHFPSDIGAVVVLVDAICSDDGWELFKDIEKSYRFSDVVRKTISVASPSAKFVSGNSESVDISTFSELDLSESERCRKAYDYLPFKDILIAPQGKAAAIYLVAADGIDTRHFSLEIEKIRDQFKGKATALGGKILLTGDPIMSTEIADVISRDITYVIGLIILLLIMIYIITKSFRVCVAGLLTIALAMVGAFGTMGWLGLAITPGTALAIFLLGPLSAAFVIHAHGYCLRNRGNSLIPREATVPTVFAGLTTAILFGCTAITPAPDVRSLAFLGIIGIGFATLGIFIVAYPLLNSAKSLRYGIRFSIPRWVIIKPWIAFTILAILVVEIFFGVSKLRFEYEAVDYLPLTNPKRAEFEEVGNWFGRMAIPLLIQTGSTNTNNPSIWKNLKSLEDKIRLHDQRIHSASFYAQITVATKALTLEDNDNFLEFPENSEQLNQIMLLFDRQDYDLYINDEQNRIAATFNVPFIGSEDYFNFKQVVEKHFEETNVDGALVGRVSGFFESGHRIGIDNLKGLAVGAAIVFLMLTLAFRSITLSTIGVVVNSIPVLTSIAALGLAGVPIDLGSSIVTAIAFGIVVDDSTHLIIRIKRLQSAGYDPATAVVRAINELVAPIAATTTMTCIGFCVLFAAEMQPFHDFATTILIALITALLADLIILPVLVRSFVRDFVRT